MEPLLHAIIPLVFLLAIFPKLNKNYVFYLLPIVWIIDLDTFFGVHRLYLHNIVFVLLVAGFVYWRWDKIASIVALYYGASHLILDLAYPGVALFYPFVDVCYYVVAQIQRAGTWMWEFSVGTISKEELLYNIVTQDAMNYFGESSFILIVLLLVLIVVKYRNKIKKVFSK
tara:strand:+ start:852 stop:1364 length:513 start_codon:yes stop_codon:yes gene_type:complete